MSLEQALAANTAALQALTAALVANPMQAPSAQPAPIPAPFTAAAVPLQIAPVASTDSSPAPTTAFAQAAAIVPPPATTAVPPTASPAGAVERDAKGMPYDGRIHSGTKAKVADGTWRYKRGVGDVYIAQVEAELRGAAAAPVQTAAAAPVVGGVGTPWPFPSEPDPAVAAISPAPIAPPPVVAPPPAPAVAAAVPPAAGVTTADSAGSAGATITSYEQLMAILPTKFVAGEITAQQLQEACEKFGVPSVAALATRPDLVVFVASALGIK